MDPLKYKELEELTDICKGLEKKEDSNNQDKKIINYLRNECGISNFVDMNKKQMLGFMTVIDACTIVVQDRIFIQVNDQGKAYYA